MRLPPLALELLLRAFYSAEPFPPHMIETEAAQEWLKRLMREDLIVPSCQERHYMTTARGTAHVRQLCNLPLPKRAWVGADNKVIPADFGVDRTTK